MAEFVHDIQSRLNQAEKSESSSSLVMEKMREILDRVAPDWFHEVFGPKANRFTPKTLEKMDEWLKILTSQINTDDRQRDLELHKKHKVLMDSMGTDTSNSSCESYTEQLSEIWRNMPHDDDSEY